MKSEVIYNLDLKKLAKDDDLGDELSFEISIKGQNQLPSWITLNTTKKSIVCSPEIGDTGTINVIVKIIDLYKAFTTDTFSITVTTNPLSIPGKTNSVVFGFYPNPASDKIEIKLTAGQYPATISIIDLSGKIILKGQSKDLHNIFDVSNISSGTYLLKVETGDIQHTKLLQVFR
jgi:hypothetical protein